ncbi:MAG: DUF5916 domain-containing protein [Saprospiraceae bacterium]|nr:DUF5916 domain-containing protein [Saprospiraceae bacterium]
MYRKNTLLSVLFIALCTLTLPIFAQNSTSKTDFQIHIKKAAAPFRIDGDLSEAAWATAEKVYLTRVHYPQNGDSAKLRTEAQVTYDDHFIYIGFTCFDDGKYIVQSLKRDVNYWASDAMAVTFDPIEAQANGVLFGVNTEGVQSEGILAGDDPDWAWDNKWFSEVKKSTDRWTVEIAIPFKSLRYDPKKTTWSINFARNAIDNGGQYYVWTKVPQQFDGISLAFMGTLVWDAPPPSEKSNVAFTPYIGGGLSKDYRKNTPVDRAFNAGLDAKMALTGSLNLDATINPDFSQIEVDEQVTNLTRFNVIFPERRTFFLENSDVLTEFGFPSARPFFSRRIGLDAQNQTVPIAYGVRLSGNLTPSVRVNAFNMHTQKTDANAANNYSAAAIQKTFWGRSYFKAGFLNRQSFNKFEPNKTDYGRNLILTYVLRSTDNKWESWGEVHNSFKDNVKGENKFGSFGGQYRDNNWRFIQDFTRVGSNYYAEMGNFNRLENYDALRDTVIRLGFKHSYTNIGYVTRPKNSKISEHNVSGEHYIAWYPNNTLNQWNRQLGYDLTFTNTAMMSLNVTHTTENVPFPFSFSDDNVLIFGKYTYTTGSFSYDTDSRKIFSGRIGATTGGFYNGNQLGLSAAATYRVQPWGKFSLKLDWNRIELPPITPSVSGITQFILLSPKSEISFNRNVHWTTFFQFNTQSNNFNINSRLQYRFRPMSDLFLVYTDDYFTSEERDSARNLLYSAFDKKNRSLVCKMTYWFNKLATKPRK